MQVLSRNPVNESRTCHCDALDQSILPVLHVQDVAKFALYGVYPMPSIGGKRACHLGPRLHRPNL